MFDNKNYMGERYGKLTITGLTYKGRYKHAICKCDCGNVKNIRLTSITKANKPTRSCGCLQLKFAVVQGKKSILDNSKDRINKDIYYNTNIEA